MSDALPARNDTPQVTISPIARRIERRTFVCGENEIDRWVVDCHKDHGRLKSRTWTATLNNGSVASIYSLRIRLESDEDIEGGKDVFRRESNHFAAVQLSYLATHRPFQRRGIGELMIMHAIREFGVVADKTGICAMTLVAINADKAAWYESLGFRSYGASCAQPKLFLPAQTAIDLLNRAAA